MTSAARNTCTTTIDLPPSPPLQPAFVALVDDALASLQQTLGPLLHSVYLYGSVARATATIGVSDVDLTLVLTRPLAADEAALLEQQRLALQARHPEVSKVDFDIGVLADVRNPAHLHSWGYWLKHECRCIHGTDLGLQFAAFAPSAAVARAVNGDYVQVLQGYVAGIAAAQDLATLRRLQKEAARKLVRATNVLRPDEGGDWPQSLEDYARYFSERFPDMAERAAFFLLQAKAPDASAEVFNAQLDAFVAWIQSHGQTSAPG
ncbi:nucleotidyltransferase domain-containing protein [Comamonas sp.]|uniref:nucleotidyltransferase domain-containing protein n=1 Tax=Comamonas sp. TaxID=34028 RepID=UPI002898A2D5|nr:nucleotidyltransferase domain-containing protein [Comamonas sp.]